MLKIYLKHLYKSENPILQKHIFTKNNRNENPKMSKF